MKVILTSFLLFLIFTSCKAQQTGNLITTFSKKLIGSWIPEGSSIDNKLVFNNDGTASKYDDGQIIDTYTWVVNEQLVNGVPFNTLKLTDINSTDNVYRYEINSLTNTLMILVYQRPNGGISGLNKYFKQE